MQTRRILLLFALVLGVAALVASLGSPPATREDDDDRSQPPPESASGQAPPAREVVFATRPGRPRAVRRVPVGSRVTVVVRASEPGDVELAALGLRQSTDGLAPVRFDFAAGAVRAIPVRFHAFGGRSRAIGRVDVVPASSVRPRARRD